MISRINHKKGSFDDDTKYIWLNSSTKTVMIESINGKIGKLCGWSYTSAMYYVISGYWVKEDGFLKIGSDEKENPSQIIRYEHAEDGFSKGLKYIWWDEKINRGYYEYKTGTIELIDSDSNSRETYVKQGIWIKTTGYKQIGTFQLKKDNWTNDEVIELLRGFQFEYTKECDKLDHWNGALDYAIEEFEEFKHDMAFDPNTRKTVYCGPILPP